MADEPKQVPPARAPWFAQNATDASEYDAQKAMSTVQMGLSGMAVLYAFWFTASAGFMGVMDPIAPMALVAAAILVAQYLLRHQMNVTVRGIVLQSSTYVIISAYLVWRLALGNPINFSTYVLIPVFAALIFGRLRTALISVGFAAVWTIGMIALGVIANPVDGESTILAIAIGGLVAFVLDQERKSNDNHTHEWRAAHANLDALLRSSQDPIFSVDSTGAVQFANEAGEDWCENVTKCRPDASRFWTTLPAPHGRNFEKVFNAAIEGQRARTSIHASIHDVDHHWEVTAVPHRSLDRAIVTLRDVTSRERHQEAILDSQVKARMDMLNLVSHELSTPLMPILIESHVLTNRLREVGTEQDVERMEAVTRNARRAINMVHQLIDQSRGLSIQAGETKTTDTPTETPKVAKAESEPNTDSR